jgi:hypothetical protein
LPSPVRSKELRRQEFEETAGVQEEGDHAQKSQNRHFSKEFLNNWFHVVRDAFLQTMFAPLKGNGKRNKTENDACDEHGVEMNLRNDE